MDPTKQRHVERKRENNSEGHDINYEISVSKLLALQSWPFKKIYNTECQKCPTSWSLKVEFLEVREDATASLFVSLQRMDSQNIELEGCIWVQICDLAECLLFPRQTFDMQKMLPGNVLEKTVEISAFADKRRLVNEYITVYITVMICFCHSDTDSSSTISASSDTNRLDEL